MPQERRDREVKEGPNESETIDFGPSYASVRTQKKTAPKHAAVAAAAVAASITSRLLSCEAHSVAAPSVKPVQLQVSAFSVLVNLVLHQLFLSGLVAEALCLSRQCCRCVIFVIACPYITPCLAPGYNGHSACRNIVACAGDRGGEGVWWTAAQHLVFARTRASTGTGGSSMSPLQHCYSPSPTSSCGVITSLAFSSFFSVVAAAYAGAHLLRFSLQPLSQHILLLSIRFATLDS